MDRERCRLRLVEETSDGDNEGEIEGEGGVSIARVGENAKMRGRIGYAAVDAGLCLCAHYKDQVTKY